MSINEADRIYEAIFDTKAPESIIKHFKAISGKIEDRFSEDEIEDYYKYIQKVQDIEALELAARYTKKLPVITEKFKIMVYLAETLPDNYKVFVNEKPGFFAAALLLTASIFRAGCKMVKGIYIITVTRI